LRAPANTSIVPHAPTRRLGVAAHSSLELASSAEFVEPRLEMKDFLGAFKLVRTSRIHWVQILETNSLWEQRGWGIDKPQQHGEGNTNVFAPFVTTTPGLGRKFGPVYAMEQSSDLNKPTVTSAAAPKQHARTSRADLMSSRCARTNTTISVRNCACLSNRCAKAGSGQMNTLIIAQCCGRSLGDWQPVVDAS